MTLEPGMHEAFEEWEAHLERTRHLCRPAPRGETFLWDGAELSYYNNPYNSTLFNERAVEVPIANAWMAKHEMVAPRVLEVGNVLQHYGWSGHDVVDLYEVADGVENKDVRNKSGRFDRIVSISTLEHVEDAVEHPLLSGPRHALGHMLGLLVPGSRMLTTTPFGQHPALDLTIVKDWERGRGTSGMLARSSTMLRDPEDGTWNEVPGAAWRPARENGWASAVWVAEWARP